MAFVYILASDDGKHYVGSTVDVDARVRRHNTGTGGRTTRGRFWRVVYSKEFVTLDEARAEEKRIKCFKGGQAFKKLIQREE